METSNKVNFDSTNLRNIFILSIGYMLLMAAWLTTAGIQQTILQSIRVDDPTFTGDGYIAQSIISGVFAVGNFIAPIIVSYIGARSSMVFAICLYSFFIGNFLYPRAWLLYTSAVVIGFGSSLNWVANGVFITQCSTKETMGKHLGIFWGVMASGQLIGNAFVFWKFQGMNHIDANTRFLVTACLTVLCILAAVTLLFLRQPPSVENKLELETSAKQTESILISIVKPIRLLGNKHMLLLIPPSMYNGLELAFFAAIYPTSVGFTEAFGGDTRKLVGLAGIVIGLGAVTGGLVFGYLIEKISFIKSKRSFIVTFCCLQHCVCLLLVYLNLPDAAPLYPSHDTSWINPPSIIIAMFCAFLFGIGDGCISPQVTGAIGVTWPDDPSPALALYLFFKGASLGAGYFVGTLTGLYNQLLIFLVITLVGTLTFQINERLITKKNAELENRECDEKMDKKHFSVVVLRKMSKGDMFMEKSV